jgi:hypothetical protein
MKEFSNELVKNRGSEQSNQLEAQSLLTAHISHAQ